MSEWIEYKLEQIAELTPGFAFKSSEFGNIGINVVKIKDITPPIIDIYGTEKVDISKYSTDKIEKYKLTKGDYVVAMTGATIGKVGKLRVAEVAYINQRVLKIKAKEFVSNDFVYYSIGGADFQMFIQNNIDSHSAQENISATSIGRYPILLPPLEEQEQIAGILSSLDDKIDLLNRQNATLEAIAETLFRQYFIENPKEDWIDGRLGDLINISSGYAYKGEYIGRGDSLLLGMGCVSYNHRFLYTGARPYAGSCPNSFMANGGDIVVATRQQSDNMPILGAPAIIPYELNDKNIIVGTNLYRVKNNSSLSNYCIYLLMRSDDYRNHIDACSKGSTVKMITKDSIESFPIMIPPHDYNLEHQDCFRIIDEKVINNNSQIRNLTKLRDNLLPKLMNNGITING